MAPKPNLKQRSTARLLGEWSAIMRELRRRGAVRSANSPTGDLAEALVAEFYGEGVKLMPNSTAAYDLKFRRKRIQVKARRRTERSKTSHYGIIRKLDDAPFDVLVVVNFDEEFGVESAYRMSIKAVRELANFSAHSNGWRLPIIKGKRAEHRGIEEISLTP